MRMMMKVVIDTHAGNKAIRDNTMGKLVSQTNERIKPEAQYFTSDNGNRTAFFFFDMKDTTQMPMIAEPFFMELNAHVSFQPVMNGEDLQKGLSQLGK